MESKILLDGTEFSYRLISKRGKHVEISVNDEIFKFNIDEMNIQKAQDFISLNGRIAKVQKPNHTGARVEKAQYSSPMPGKVLKVFVKEGQIVSKGETLLILEAMKMEHKITAHKDLKVLKVLFKDQELVKGGEELIKVEELDVSKD